MKNAIDRMCRGELNTRMLEYFKTIAMVSRHIDEIVHRQDRAEILLQRNCHVYMVSCRHFLNRMSCT